MRTVVFGWALFAAFGFVPAAGACHLVHHPDPVRDFLRERRLVPPSSAVVFSGKVISVSEDRNADGDRNRSIAVEPTRWWIGNGHGPVVVRSVTPSLVPPCGPPPPLEAKAGERWLIFGTVRDGWVEPDTDSRLSLRLLHGRVPSATQRALRAAARRLTARGS